MAKQFYELDKGDPVAVRMGAGVAYGTFQKYESGPDILLAVIRLDYGETCKYEMDSVEVVTTARWDDCTECGCLIQAHNETIQPITRPGGKTVDTSVFEFICVCGHTWTIEIW